MDVQVPWGSFLSPGLLLLGGLTLGWREWARRKLARVARWIPASAEVVRSDVVREQGRKNVVYRMDVHYRYQAQGNEFTGSRISLGGEIDTSSEAYARKRAAHYPVGTAVTAYHDPFDPAQACLKREILGFAASGWIGLASVAASLLAWAFPLV